MPRASVRLSTTHSLIRCSLLFKFSTVDFQVLWSSSFSFIHTSSTRSHLPYPPPTADISILSSRLPIRDFASSIQSIVTASYLLLSRILSPYMGSPPMSSTQNRCSYEDDRRYPFVTFAAGCYVCYMDISSDIIRFLQRWRFSSCISFLWLVETLNYTNVSDVSACCLVLPLASFTFFSRLSSFRLFVHFSFARPIDKTTKTHGKGYENPHTSSFPSRFSFCLHFSERFWSSLLAIPTIPHPPPCTSLISHHTLSAPFEASSFIPCCHLLLRLIVGTSYAIGSYALRWPCAAVVLLESNYAANPINLVLRI